MLKKRAGFDDAISIPLTLLALNFACSGRKIDATSQPPSKSSIPPLKPFEFQMVTLDANGRVASRHSAQALPLLPA
jgi:hypothetical protein